MIDLHIHTTASDGVYSPEKILEMAADSGLEAISITDHDTLEGSRKAFKLTGKNIPQILTGVEISTCAPKKFNIFESVHILGYRIDLNNHNLEKELLLLQNSRKKKKKKKKKKQYHNNIYLIKIKKTPNIQ
eukprot:TRINITY_DN17147_c0_g1_i1.p2 TRINITY_DN17147_c0_g1~~TRINITY_DN17147_c0_g1_i1.p2  ORF type:complete len:131 (-),score=30.94 TRINITY_DN17147_c0_g1_i1:34-426(-)